MTIRDFWAPSPGPLVVHVTSPVGKVKAIVDSRLRHAQVTVETGEDSGRFAEAVNDTEVTEEQVNYGRRLRVTVPEVRPVTHRHAGATYNFGENGTFVGGMTFGSGIQATSEGDVFIGGRKVVQDGRVVVDKGTVVGGPAATITVTVRLPRECAVLLSSTSAGLEVVGDVAAVGVTSVSGAIELGGAVGWLTVNTVSGNVVAERVDRNVSHTSVSGSLEVLAYSGEAFESASTGGTIRVTATPASTGVLRANSVSGDVVTTGAGHLDLRTSSMTGRARNH
ncbi:MULTISPECIES: hypothetical protein [unclassified Streptomyces]|uniref:hypothetical protein n=1 Tax=unclassified Streptomyces TaxID=2593676 RepID=UPI00081D9935|nr:MULTISPECIES: hypothetical protein [unclassified Streptomyces]MYZ37918.1 hypothetical protein [Streptomyces sp. SID4917]SCF95158.1 hypothetical protein GA0115259_105476 [Streptomyces sp. MnatMP-M17]